MEAAAPGVSAWPELTHTEWSVRYLGTASALWASHAKSFSWWWEDLKRVEGRVVQHCKESTQWHWHRAGDGTKDKRLHSKDKALPLNPGGGGRDITTIHRLWVGSHRWKHSKHRQWTQGKRRVFWWNTCDVKWAVGRGWVPGEGEVEDSQQMWNWVLP